MKRIGESYTLLLFALVGWQVANALIPMKTAWAQALNSLSFLGLLLAAAMTAAQSVSARRLRVAVALVLSFGIVTNNFWPNPHIQWIWLLVAFLFLTYIGWQIIIHVLSQPQVTRDVLAGAICGFLFLTVNWAVLYLVIETLVPGSFLENGKPVVDEGWATYFSAVTMSSLGYGDILPMTRLARFVASFEAIFGQLYLVILVGRLVGMVGQGEERVNVLNLPVDAIKSTDESSDSKGEA